MSKWETAEELAVRLVGDVNKEIEVEDAVRVRDAQVRDRLAAALESAEPFAACRALLADLGGEVTRSEPASFVASNVPATTREELGLPPMPAQAYVRVASTDRGTLINQAATLGARAVKMLEAAQRMPRVTEEEREASLDARIAAHAVKSEADQLWQQVRATYERGTT